MRTQAVGGVVCWFALACAGCGAASGLELPAGGDGQAGGSPGTIAPSPCRAVSSWTVYAGSDSAYGAAVVADAGVVGLLFWSDDLMGPRDLRFAKLDFLAPAPITSWITLTSTPLITQAGVAARGGAFFAAWVDEASRVHVGRLGQGALDTDVVVGGSPGLEAATLGTTGGGRLAAVWNEMTGETAALRAATSADGVSFGAPSTLSTDGLPTALSVAPAASGAAVAWSASFESPDHSALHFALAGEDGAPVVPDAALTHHKRYVYDVGVVRAGGRFVIATTDSRVNIGNVPLYSTSVSLDGHPAGVDTRLTFSGEHEDLDAVFDGAAVALGYDEYRDGGSQIFVRQLDATGADLFGPFQVSHATYPEYGCCTDTRYATIATDGDGRLLVIWSEAEARPAGASAFSLKAALLDCASRG